MSTSGAESESRKRSNKIDKDLEEDSKRLRKECKILLLGAFAARHSRPLSGRMLTFFNRLG